MIAISVNIPSHSHQLSSPCCRCLPVENHANIVDKLPGMLSNVHDKAVLPDKLGRLLIAFCWTITSMLVHRFDAMMHIKGPPYKIFYVVSEIEKIGASLAV